MNSVGIGKPLLLAGTLVAVLLVPIVGGIILPKPQAGLISTPRTADGNTISSIVIDENWSATRATYNWCTGSGMPSDPYIIQSMTITLSWPPQSTCISITNTSDYFCIQDCNFITSAGIAAILLTNVGNGTISGNNCSGANSNGIDLVNSNNNTISGNNCTGINDGIYLDTSNDNAISGNNFNGGGICLSYSANNTLSGNNCSENSQYGISL